MVVKEARTVTSESSLHFVLETQSRPNPGCCLINNRLIYCAFLAAAISAKVIIVC